MQGFNMVRRALLKTGFLLLVAVLVTASVGVDDAIGNDGANSLGELGAKALENLPWPATVLKANLSKGRAVAIEGCYLMSKQLLVVTAGGKVYCLDRRNLEPRWVNNLKFPLAKAPAEGANDYVFLMKDAKGAHWAMAISKRSGSIGARFPVRLPYATSSGIAANSAMMFVGSLGRPGNNKTLESVNLISGRPGWGYRSSGMLWGAPTLDPAGDILVIVGDDGVVTALPAGASAPKSENWMRKLGAGIRSGAAVTPASVLTGTSDGVFYSLDLFSGKVNWLAGLDKEITESPWVFGSYKTSKKSSGVEGSAPIEVRSYEGITCVRNVDGTHAFDLKTGKKLFTCKKGERPLVRQGKYLLTSNLDRRITLRDATKDYAVVGSMNLGMFDLIPSNKSNGELFACTADGSIVVAIPK
jgi:outer membrane protein assembly factor BamB